MNVSDAVRKNLLDLHFQQNVQYFMTTIVLLFTYLIGVMIGFFTGQIDYKNAYQLAIIAAISVFFLSVGVAFVIKFQERIVRIPEEIKKLRI